MKKLIMLSLVISSLLIAQAHGSEKNQLVVLAGEGAQKGFSGNTMRVERTGKEGLTRGFKRGFVGGVQYQRQITDKISLGVQALTSDTYLGLIGIKF